MTAETWQTIGTIAALLAIGAFNAWQGKRAERAAKAAHLEATTAATQTRGTGNGFAEYVRESLARIDKRSEQTHELMVNHLQAHADSDLDSK